jgi:hypothetical protein
MLHPRFESHEGGHRRICRAKHARNRSAERGPTAGRLLALAPAGLAHEVGVVINRVADGADDGVAMGLLREQRQVFADLETRHRGRDRFELAAYLGRRVELEVEGVLMRRPARQVDHDHRLVPGVQSRGGLGAEQLRQRQPAHAERADAQEVPARKPVAKAARRSGYGEHCVEQRRREGAKKEDLSFGNVQDATEPVFQKRGVEVDEQAKREV